MTGGAPILIGTGGEPTALDADQVGSKAAQLARMVALGLPVPPAFVMPTTLCGPVNRRDPAALDALRQGLAAGIAALEAASGLRFGNRRRPLLVSVRSGAARSMPGMLSTVLNVGLNAASVRGLIGLHGNPRLAWDCYRRFLQSYGETVGGIPASVFDRRIADLLRAEGVDDEADLDPEALERLTNTLLALVDNTQQGRPPDTPMAQAVGGWEAVYRSWDEARAMDYRRLNRLDRLTGTAVTVQMMVFGNAGRLSGSGVAFSRNPATGEPGLYADFLFDAQGEDVVAGRRRPGNVDRLAARLPLAARALADGVAALERDQRDMQDVEFTIEAGKLYFLQTRAAKRTPRAALRSLVDLVRADIIDRRTALARFETIDIARTYQTRFRDDAPSLAMALPASAGVASGRAAFDTPGAKALAAQGDPVILLRHDMATEDVAGFAVAAGILTATGGRTSHAAVVARELGKVCLVGCVALRFDRPGHAEIAGQEISEGDWLSLDGETGAVTLGRREIVSEAPTVELAEIETWRADLITTETGDKT